MPIYEYQCQACGHYLEAFQKMSEAPLIECPACQKSTLQKWVSAAGFQLKGTGWYVTDFRNKTKPESPSPAQAQTQKTGEGEKGKGEGGTASSEGSTGSTTNNTGDSTKADKT